MKTQYYDVGALIDGTTMIDGKEHEVLISYELPLPEIIYVPDEIPKDEIHDYVYKHSTWTLRNFKWEYQDEVLAHCYVTWTNEKDDLKITTDIFAMPKGSYQLTVDIENPDEVGPLTTLMMEPIGLSKIQKMYRNGIFRPHKDNSVSYGACFQDAKNLINQDYVKWLANQTKNAQSIDKERIIVSDPTPTSLFHPYKRYVNEYLLANRQSLQKNQANKEPIVIEIPFPHVNGDGISNKDELVSNGKNYPKKLDLSVLPEKYQTEMVKDFWKNTAKKPDEKSDETFANPWHMLTAIYEMIGGFHVIQSTPNYEETEEHDDYDIMRIKIPYDRILWPSPSI